MASFSFLFFLNIKLQSVPDLDLRTSVVFLRLSQQLCGFYIRSNPSGQVWWSRYSRTQTAGDKMLTQANTTKTRTQKLIFKYRWYFSVPSRSYLALDLHNQELDNFCIIIFCLEGTIQVLVKGHTT